MTFQRSTALLLFLAFTFALPTCFPEGVATASSGANQQPRVTAWDIACVFMKSPEEVDRSEVLAKAHIAHTTQEIYGYAHEIPLQEAVRGLNAQLQCYAPWAVLPPITEAEVVANAIGGADYNEVLWTDDKSSAMKKIASSRMMLKGSLFRTESGACDYGPRRREQTCVQGLKIYLFLGLDKNPRATEVLGPGQIVLIRKTYFKTYIGR